MLYAISSGCNCAPSVVKFSDPGEIVASVYHVCVYFVTSLITPSLNDRDMQIGRAARCVTTFWRLSTANLRSSRSKQSLNSPPNGARRYSSSSLWRGPYTKLCTNRGSPFLPRPATVSSMMGNKDSKGEKGEVPGVTDAGEYVEAVVAKSGELKDGE